MSSNEPGFNVPTDLLYTKNHEWVKFEDGTATVGITDYAQNQLGDITYVELPEKGDSFKKDAVLGTVDSLKTVAEIYAPVTGEITEVNEDLPNEAENVNEKPYEAGWMVRIDMDSEAELDELLQPDAYLKLISKLSKK